MRTLNGNRLYRMPWSLYDNPQGWVEISDVCNMTCQGCYREYLETDEGHKSVDDIVEEVRFLNKKRNVSLISISGGEPLLHPDLIDIVKYISDQGLRIKIFTNGKLLTSDLVARLRRVGLNQLTVHIDTGQTRNDDWGNGSELILNDLRQHYVDMCREENGLNVNFATMVSKDNLDQIPAIMQWALDRQIDFLTFTAVRQSRIEETNQGPRMVLIDPERNLRAMDIHQAINREYSRFEPCAYFGGTVDAGSLKWLISISICQNGRILGSLGPVSVELHQSLKHLFYGQYLFEDDPRGKLLKPLVSAICFASDRKLRQAVYQTMRNPGSLRTGTHILATAIIQGHDILPSGEMDMCDGCPDMTYFKGRLVNSCRLDEYRKYGQMISGINPNT